MSGSVTISRYGACDEDVDRLWSALPSLAGKRYTFTSTSSVFTEISINCSECGFRTTDVRGYAALVKDRQSYRDSGRAEHWELDIYGWCIRCYPYKLLHAQIELWPDSTIRCRQDDGSTLIWAPAKVKRSWWRSVKGWFGRTSE